MKCLVTGGCGFIGSHLVKRLYNEGQEVAVIDNLSAETETRFDLPINYFIEDIRDSLSIFKNHKFDVIYHLAAISSIKNSYKDILETHATNVTGTVTMLELARKSNAKFILASTCAIEGKSHTTQYNLSPYALSKKISEDYCRLYRTAYELDTIALRLFNVYGPGDIKSVVSKFLERQKENLPLTITGAGGGGKQARDFIHVDDVVEALIKARDATSLGPFNVCTGKLYSIVRLAGLMGESYTFIPQRKGENYTFFETHPTLPEWSPKINLESYLSELDL